MAAGPSTSGRDKPGGPFTRADNGAYGVTATTTVTRTQRRMPGCEAAHAPRAV